MRQHIATAQAEYRMRLITRACHRKLSVRPSQFDSQAADKVCRQKRRVTRRGCNQRLPRLG